MYDFCKRLSHIHEMLPFIRVNVEALPRSDFSFEGLSASILLGGATTCAWVLVAHRTSCHIQKADVARLLPRQG